VDASRALETEGASVRDRLRVWEESIGALSEVHDHMLAQALEAARAAEDVREEVAEGVKVLVGEIARTPMPSARA
jgi:hypothetical protein